MYEDKKLIQMHNFLKNKKIIYKKLQETINIYIAIFFLSFSITYTFS